MSRDQDPIGAIIAYLKTKSAVTDLTSTRIFGQELPRSEVSNMPRRCLVVSSAGGVLGHIEATTMRQVRVDIRCYGESPKQAMDLHITTDTTLSDLNGEASGNTYISSVFQETAPLSLRDPDLDFAYVQSPYLLQYNTVNLSS